MRCSAVGVPETPQLSLDTGPKQSEQARVSELRREMTGIRSKYDELLVRHFRQKAIPEKIRQTIAERDRLLAERDRLIDLPPDGNGA